MLSKLKSTLKSNFIRPLLGFFGMSTAKLPFIKDTTPSSIVMYYDWFMNYRLDLDTYRVVQVNWYKDMDSVSQHEKIIAKIKTAEPGVFGYLRFERMPGSAVPQTLAQFFSKHPADTEIEKVRSALIEDTRPSGLIIDQASISEHTPNDFTPPTPKRSSKSDTSTLVSSSSDSLAQSNAADTVTQVHGFPAKKGRIKTLYPSDLLLCDLVVLAYTIHSKHPMYIVFKEQCYWFASTIMSLLESEYHFSTDVTVTDEHHVDEVYESIGGKWHKITVHKTEKCILETIASQFKTDLAAFKVRVQEMESAEEQAERDRGAREVAEEVAERERERAEREGERAEREGERAEREGERAEREGERAERERERAERERQRADEAEETTRQTLLEIADLKKQLQAASSLG